MSSETALAKSDEVHPLARVLTPAVAMWLGWGIRGQIGHETGAMIPGALAGLSLALEASEPEIRRRSGLLGATGAMGMSFGGTETYGQTIGLTQGKTRDETYWWGLLGLAIKGGAWIGLAGTYLGMAAGDRDYSPLEILGLTGAMTALWHLGVETINRPHEPPDRLPRWYFSGEGNDPPRPEVWAGQWFALLGLLTYTMLKGDRAAAITGAYGILGGAAGFSGAQAIQAWMHKKGISRRDGLWRYLDAWKIMETSYGFIAGAYLGAGMMIAESVVSPLAPRKPTPLWQAMLGRAAGSFAIISHLLDRPWTVAAMDQMIIANAAMANAFGCEVCAWSETLPLVHWYTAKNAIAYFRTEANLDAIVPAFKCWSGVGAGILAALSPALAYLERNGSRVASAVGLLLAAWGQTKLSHVKMLVDRQMFDIDDGKLKPTPVTEIVKRVYDGSKKRRPGQFGTEAAFTVAAVLLTGLVAYALRKRE